MVVLCSEMADVLNVEMLQIAIVTVIETRKQLVVLYYTILQCVLNIGMQPFTRARKLENKLRAKLDNHAA